jgi:hypothetical protein
MILSYVLAEDNFSGDLHLGANTTNGFTAPCFQSFSLFSQPLVDGTQQVS